MDPWPRSVERGASVAVSCGVGRRRSSDPRLLWLWCRLAAAAQIRSLAWELPYAAVKKEKRKRKKEKKNGNEDVPAVEQWVKNRTTVACVTVDSWVRSLAWHSG